MSGFRTYWVCGLIIALSIAHSNGFVEKAAYESLLPIFGSFALIYLRAGVKKAEQNGHSKCSKCGGSQSSSSSG
jgi:hypothetical protein